VCRLAVDGSEVGRLAGRHHRCVFHLEAVVHQRGATQVGRRAAYLGALAVHLGQLGSTQVIHDSRAERVAEHVQRRSDTVPVATATHVNTTVSPRQT